MVSSKVRVICISDTHNAAPGEGFTLPKGDILIHAGDLTNQGSYRELKKAVDWIAKTEYPVKIVTAGNHDLSLDPEYTIKHDSGWRVQSEDVDECRRLVFGNPDIVFVNHKEVSIPILHKGVSIRIFGSPYSPDRGKHNWAFQYDESGASMWEDIPDDLDILITHTPPKGFCDTSSYWVNGGCGRLKAAIARARPRLHVCGHCHEGRGSVTVDWDRDEAISVWQDPGEGSRKQSLLDLTSPRAQNGHFDSSSCNATTVVNACITATSYGRGVKKFNKPIVVDLLLPITSGITEEQVPKTEHASN